MEDNNEILQMYLDELETVKPLSDEEIEKLSDKVAAGDPESMNKVVEGLLKRAMELITDYLGKGLSVQELIGEANLALTTSVHNYKSGNLKEFILGSVKEELDRIVDEETKISYEDTELAAKANRLQDVAKDMAIELGHEPTTHELAERMGESEEEVEMLMKMSMQALNQNE